MTARQLYDRLATAGCEPAADGFDLVFAADPPAHLIAALEVLHTGVRAIRTGRRWFAFDPATGRACGPHPARGHGPLAYGALDPACRVPPTAGYLSVEGDECWDRIPPFARTDLPHLFAPDVELGPG